MDTATALTAVGIGITLVVQSITLWSALVNRMDAGDKSNREERERQIIAVETKFETRFKLIDERTDEVHARVNDVKDNYVRRDDFEKHMAKLEREIGDLRKEMREMSNQIGTRMDLLLTALGRAGHIERRGD